MGSRVSLTGSMHLAAKNWGGTLHVADPKRATFNGSGVMKSAIFSRYIRRPSQKSCVPFPVTSV
jgi:hypothetical protein